MSAPLSLRRRAYLAWWRLRHRGTARWCPACGATAARFAPYGRPPRPDAQCAACGSLERHRALWLFLQTRADLLAKPLRVLAVAPDPQLDRRARDLSWDHLSVDIEPGRAMRAMDLTALDLPDRDRDLVIAFHVLEHIPDDAAAMREIARVLRPEGLAVLEVPLDGEETDERHRDAPPEVRARHYGQPDHVRIYGTVDFVRRLGRAGLAATPVHVGTAFAADVQRAALLADETFHVATLRP